MSDDLKVLQPGREVVLNINGTEKVIEVKPFKTGQLLKVIKPISELAKIFNQSEGNILDLIVEGGDKVVNLVCMVTNLKKEEFEELELDETVNLVGAIIGENKDFFEKKLVPAIEQMTNQVMKKPASGVESTQG